MEPQVAVVLGVGIVEVVGESLHRRELPDDAVFHVNGAVEAEFLVHECLYLDVLVVDVKFRVNYDVPAALNGIVLVRRNQNCGAGLMQYTQVSFPIFSRCFREQFQHIMLWPHSWIA